ncbi:sialic acid-binding Ig-like lectin 15 isoform X2 [Acanthopagrus latus]|uniref:sialic acid-binding Ig-like lectin 15 isoform X2 n=1 Tax=Acanthopagrus latus TaxID=8177 RepID=UPI00187BDB44|nr:sialic acid-binding Ig-like lectin 15 isoform X2 [Acanthopagrus latus]
MWQQTDCFCVILSAIITGSLSVSWDMKVSPVVSVPRGEDAVLSCSFTHPRQQDYSGLITVKWIARETNALPFFKCSVRNDSMEELKDCSGSELKHSLRGDPRQGDLSLVIRKVHVADSGPYFCRVELDGWRQNQQGETRLRVTVKPQILSLSVVELSSDSTTRRLQCEVEGNPPPSITWLSASRGLLTDQVFTSEVNLEKLYSSVPYVEGEVFTCRVENMLGGAERRYPADNTLIITLSVCGLIVLLLLCAGIICCRRRRAQHESLKSSNSRHLEEEGVVYSPVNVQ